MSMLNANVDRQCRMPMSRSDEGPEPTPAPAEVPRRLRRLRLRRFPRRLPRWFPRRAQDSRASSCAGPAPVRRQPAGAPPLGSPSYWPDPSLSGQDHLSTDSAVVYGCESPTGSCMMVKNIHVAKHSGRNEAFDRIMWVWGLRARRLVARA